MASLDYLGGLFDGEGTFTVHMIKNVRRNGTCSLTLVPQVSLGNTNKDLVDICRERWGGKVKKMPIRNPKHKQFWHWIVSGEAALVACRDLMDHLIGKRDVCLSVAVAGDMQKGCYRRGDDNSISLFQSISNAKWKEFITELNKRGA